jgi:hypothetical protein
MRWNEADFREDWGGSRQAVALPMELIMENSSVEKTVKTTEKEMRGRMTAKPDRGSAAFGRQPMN